MSQFEGKPIVLKDRAACGLEDTQTAVHDDKAAGPRQLSAAREFHCSGLDMGERL